MNVCKVNASFGGVIPLIIWSPVLQDLLWLSWGARPRFQSLEAHVNLAKTTMTLGTSYSALIHLPTAPWVQVLWG